MSTKNLSLIVGLTAPGILGVAAICLVTPASTPAQVTPASEAPTSPYTVLLLKNGRILRGPLSEDQSGYVILQKAGTIRFPKKDVERAFRTIREVYEHKLTQLAMQDPDEHMKLAHWCLSESLRDEARERLSSVLELDPGNQQALAMMSSLQREERRLAQRAGQLDPQVARTANSSDSSSPASTNALESMLLEQVRRSQKTYGYNSLPQILDLPPEQAVKRYNEFGRYVHPVLQYACARCHNDQYAGDFRLVQVHVRRELSDHTVIRANLDATLQLVDPLNLSQSSLLSNALLPHGPSRRPIFRGYNDPSYKVLASWVQTLRPSVPGAPSSPGTLAPSEGFAVDRSEAFQAAAQGGGLRGNPNVQVLPPVGPAPASLPGPLPPPDGDPAFPVSPLITGVPPLSTPPGPPIAPEELPALPDTPPMPAATAEEKSTKPAKSKKTKVDPALLEQLLRSRNGGAPGGP